MQLTFSSIAAAALALTSAVVASPVANASPDTVESRSPVNQYYIKTRLADNQTSTGTNKDGLYLYSHHTGAGLGIGGLKPTPPEGWYVFTGADNQQYFTYNGSLGNWPLQVEQYAPYQAWAPTTISVSGPRYSGEGFVFDLKGSIVYNNTNNGWLACDWWYNVPQLFLLQGYYPTDHPESCSIVELYTETIYA